LAAEATGPVPADGWGIVAFAHNPWDGPWMNRQQLLSRLAPTLPVIYSNGPWMSWDVGSPAWRRAPITSRIVARGSVLVEQRGKCLVRVPRWGWLDRATIRRVGERLTTALAPVAPRTCTYVFHPAFWPYVESTTPQLVVYHAYDAFSLQAHWAPELEAFERRLIERADLIIASSSQIADTLARYGDVAAQVVLNGVDYDAFASGLEQPEPVDLRPIPPPRVTYAGAINRKVDFDALRYLATRRPEWQVVLIGHEGGLETDQVSRVDALRALPNVHFLGAKPPGALGAYLARSDVNLMCYSVDSAPWVRAGFPLKLFEYLAAGPPVIGTPLPALLDYREVVAFASTPEEWLAAVDHALSTGGQGTRADRRAVAAANTWDARAAQILDLLRGAQARLR
jgi:glycosyltransferase involved in cell wall biosynthesis